MRKAIKKLTAVLLSVCLTFPALSLTAVSASALGNDEGVVDVTGKTEFEYTGECTVKYTASSDGKMICFGPEDFNSAWVTDDNENEATTYLGRNMIAFVSEAGKTYYVTFGSEDFDETYKCTVEEKEIPELALGELTDAKIESDGGLCFFSYTPVETGSYRLKCRDINYYADMKITENGDTQEYCIWHFSGAEFDANAGERCYLVIGLPDDDPSGFKVYLDCADYYTVGDSVSYYSDEGDEGSKSYVFRATGDMSVLVKGSFYGDGERKLTVTDSKGGILGECTADTDDEAINILCGVKKGGLYTITFDCKNTESGFSAEIYEVWDITAGIPFMVNPGNSIICRYAVQNDSSLVISPENGYLSCERFDSSFSHMANSLVKGGETYYFIVYTTDIYTVRENPLDNTEIKLGESKDITVTNVDAESVLTFKPEKDVRVRFFASRDDAPQNFEDSRIYCEVTEQGGQNRVLTQSLKNAPVGDFDLSFMAEAGKTYVFSNIIYSYGDDSAAECTVTLEECPEYVIKDGMLIVDYSGDTEVKIPSHYNPPYDPEDPEKYYDANAEGALEVTAIAYTTYQGNTDIVSVDIPDTVKSIDRVSFAGCTNLKSVKLSQKLESIMFAAFNGCSSLKSLTVPDTVTEIGYSAFAGCVSLEEIKLPGNLETIDDAAFDGCRALTKVNIPGKTKLIGECAFQSCSSLAEVNLADGVETIGKGAFTGCESLKEITIPKSVTAIGEYALGFIDMGYNEWVEYDEDGYGDYRHVDGKPYDGFVIKGCKGTEAERYANDNGFTFVALDEAEPNPTEYGDSNGDGEINISDATEIQRFIADIDKFNAAQLKFADVTKDGTVNIEDVTMIQKYLVGLVKTLG